MRYLTIDQVILLHQRILAVSGGGPGIRDFGGLESSIAQPAITFDGVDLYPTLVSKAAAIGFLLITSHPFVDGNKRVGHAAMEVMLLINGSEIVASIDEQEQIILSVAAGSTNLNSFTAWLAVHLVPCKHVGD